MRLSLYTHFLRTWEYPSGTCSSCSLFALPLQLEEHFVVEATLLDGSVSAEGSIVV